MGCEPLSEKFCLWRVGKVFPYPSNNRTCLNQKFSPRCKCEWWKVRHTNDKYFATVLTHQSGKGFHSESKMYTFKWINTVINFVRMQVILGSREHLFAGRHVTLKVTKGLHKFPQWKVHAIIYFIDAMISQISLSLSLSHTLPLETYYKYKY